MLLGHNEPAMLSRQSELTNTERNTKHEKRAQKKLIPYRPKLWMNLLQTPIYHGFCYTHFIMEKELTLDYVALTVAHLRDDINQMLEYNGAYWHEDTLNRQLNRAFTTTLLLGDLVDELKRGAE